MEETPVTIIGIIIAAVIMFIVPVMMISDRADDISQLVVQTATEQFIDDVIKTGKITESRYQEFVSGLLSSGNTYEVNMELKILDENTSKMVTDGDYTKVGNNTYYSIYTTQIEDKMNELDGELLLKQGDGISVTVKNSSATLSQALKSFYYNSRGESMHIIAATASGTIAINGTT